jgi:lipopolysaccharide export LptBFGC system permease protein LptF
MPPPRRAPTRKVAAGGVAGALSAIIVYVLNQYVIPSAKQIPPEMASLLTTVISFITGYWTKPGHNE